MTMNTPYFVDIAQKVYPERPTLEGRLDTDILIVGGGITGIATAYEISKIVDPSRITLIDSGRVGFSTTGHSSGLLVDSIEEDYCDMDRNVYAEVKKGQDSIVEIIEQENLDCDLRKMPSLYIATKKKRQIGTIEEEYEARRQAGFLVSLVDKEQATACYGINAELAMRNEEGYCLDPARFCQEMARVLESRGVKICERTRLKKYLTKTKQAFTESGSISYKQMVLTNSNINFDNNPSKQKALLLSTSVAVTEPLTDEQYHKLFRQCEYMGWDAPEVNYMYFRPVGNNRILIGGSDKLVSSRSVRSHKRPNTEEDKDRANVKSLFENTFPDLKNVKFSHEWSGIIPTSVDGLSLVGEFIKDHYMGLYGGGLPTSYRAGQLLAERFSGRTSDSALLFGDRRKIPVTNRIRALTKYQPFTAIANRIYFS